VVKLHDKKSEVMDYSYARTAHSVQGATDRGAVPVLTAGGSATARQAYVASTRETHSLEVITDDADKLCKQVSKYVDRQTALGESKAKLITDQKEIEDARRDASLESGGVGDLAKKRAAQQALQEPAQVFIDMPDALDPDLGSEKFKEKVEAAMEKAAKNEDAAHESDNAAATGGQATAGATEPVSAAAPAPTQAEPEPELGD
jgi:phage tail sheath protein FI